MVTIREYREADFEEVVSMYYDMCITVYPHREFKSIQHFYTNVLRWIESGYDINITEDDGVVTGFTMCYLDCMGGIVEDYYQAECLYVKPKYRRGRSAYLLYNTALSYADSQDWLISTNASTITDGGSMASKYAKSVFIQYERLSKTRREQ